MRIDDDISNLFRQRRHADGESAVLRTGEVYELLLNTHPVYSHLTELDVFETLFEDYEIVGNAW